MNPDYPFIRFHNANPCVGLLHLIEQIIGESNVNVPEDESCRRNTMTARLYCYPLGSGIGRKGGGFVFVNLKAQRAAFVTRETNSTPDAHSPYKIHTHKHNNPSQHIASWENVESNRYPKTTLDSTTAANHILGFLTEGDN
jgi:hypothetical protein